MKKIFLFCLFPFCVFGHPVEDLMPIAKKIENQRVVFEECNNAILSKESIIDNQYCDKIAKHSAVILEKLVQVLEYENLSITKQNRKKLIPIAWREMRVLDFLYVSSVISSSSIQDPTEYIADVHPEMITKYLSIETVVKLQNADII